jgi:hypothetical protein
LTFTIQLSSNSKEIANPNEFLNYFTSSITVCVDFLFILGAISSLTQVIPPAQTMIVSISTSLQIPDSMGFSFQYGGVASRDQIDDGSVTFSCPFNPNSEVLWSLLQTVTASDGGDIFED